MTDRRARVKRDEAVNGAWILRELSPGYGKQAENGIENRPISVKSGGIEA
ncbi:MAG: hypothetical protein V1929_11585 [bacterium]